MVVKAQILKFNICMIMILTIVFSIVCDFSTPIVYAAGSTVTPATLTDDDLKKLTYGTSGGTMEEFYKKHLMSAYKLYLATGMSTAASLGQLALESGWGSTKLATKFYNFWGMKCNYKHRGWTSCKGHGVTHYESDNFTDSINSNDTYRAYTSMDAAFMDRPAFFYESSYYPNITEKLKNGTANTYQSLFDSSTQKDWSSYCNSGYRTEVTKLIEGRQGLAKLDDEAFVVAMLEHLGLYKNGDPIQVGDKTFYPGTKSVYQGESIVIGTNPSVNNPTGGSNIAYPDINDFIIIKPGEIQKIELEPVEQLKYDEYKAIADAKDYLSNQEVLILPRAISVLLIWSGAIILFYCILLFLAHMVDISAGGFNLPCLTLLTFGRMRSIPNALEGDVPPKSDNGKLNISTRKLIPRLMIGASFGILCWQIEYVMYIITLIYIEVQHLISVV